MQANILPLKAAKAMPLLQVDKGNVRSARLMNAEVFYRHCHKGVFKGCGWDKFASIMKLSKPVSEDRQQPIYNQVEFLPPRCD